MKPGSLPSYRNRWCFIVMFAFCVCVYADSFRLYVAPGGDDRWSGRLAEPAQDGTDGPFASLERARDEVRNLKQSGQIPVSGVTVVLRGGAYFRGEILTLEEQDSGTPEGPITYMAAAGEAVHLKACRTLSGFHKITDAGILKRLPEGAGEHVLETDLKTQGITDFGTIGLRTRQSPLAAPDLYAGGTPMTLARWPNEGFVRVAGAPNGQKGGMFAYTGDRPARWVEETDARGCGYWAHDWAASNVAFAKIDLERHIIETRPPHSTYGYRKGGRYFAYNLLSELDSPGEWYLDRSDGRLYFWPPETNGTSDVELSAGSGFLKLGEVSHVRFRGIIFEGCRGEAISIKGGEDVQVIGCTIRNAGTRAMSITGGRDHRVAGCDIYDINEGGITCTGGDRDTLTPANHTIENCVFTRVGRWQHTYVPAIGLSGVGCRVAHNLMYNIAHSVLLFSGNDHMIEYNEVHTMGFEGGEMGAFYCGRNWTLNGNVIRYNYIHDIYNPCPQRNRAFMLDDGAAGITMIGNLIVRVAEGISLSSVNNAVINNVFVDCHPAIGCWGGAESFPVFDPQAGHNPTKWPPLEKLALDRPPWSERFPEMLGLRAAIRNGGPVPPECRTRLHGNVAWQGAEKWLGFHMTKSESAWDIDNNCVGVDPLFVAETKDDFRFRPESPALAMGIKPLPVEMMGLYASDERASWPVVHPLRPEVCHDYVYVRPPPPPRPVVPPIQVPRLSSLPVIDGALAENEWPGPSAVIEQEASGDVVFSPSRVWLGRDDTALYVAFSNPVNGTSPMDLGSKWGKSEAVEIALRKFGDVQAPTLVLRGYAGGSFESSTEAKADPASARRAAEGVRYAAKPVNAGLWTCEWCIPLASLGVAPGSEQSFHANFTVRKVADNLWVMWAGTTGFSWEVERAGKIILGQ